MKCLFGFHNFYVDIIKRNLIGYILMLMYKSNECMHLLWRVEECSLLVQEFLHVLYT